MYYDYGYFLLVVFHILVKENLFLVQIYPKIWHVKMQCRKQKEKVIRSVSPEILKAKTDMSCEQKHIVPAQITPVKIEPIKSKACQKGNISKTYRKSNISKTCRKSDIPRTYNYYHYYTCGL